MDADRFSTPPSVRWIRRVADGLAKRRWLATAGVAATLVLGWLLSGAYVIDVSENGALLRFGRLADTSIGPGFGIALPPFYRVERANTGEVQRVEITGDQLPELSLLSADENVIDLRSVVQYKVTDVGNYLLGVDDPRLLLEQAVRAGLVETIATMVVDDVLTAGKAEIEHAVRTRAQQEMDLYGTGITLVSVNLQSVNPPIEAAAAFRSVSDARAEAARLVNDAESERSRSVILARGESSRLVAEAEAEAARRRESARGSAERFLQVLDRKRALPGQTYHDLYLEMVRTVLPRARIVLLAPGQKPDIEVNLSEPRKPDEAPPSELRRSLFGVDPAEGDF